MPLGTEGERVRGKDIFSVILRSPVFLSDDVAISSTRSVIVRNEVTWQSHLEDFYKKRIKRMRSSRGKAPLRMTEMYNRRLLSCAVYRIDVFCFSNIISA